MHSSFPLFAAVAVLLAIGLAGCGPRRPALYGVSGEVYLHGKPVTGAGVLFCPEGGRPAGAVTDDAGCFQLRTWRDADGTVAGTSVVCVTKEERIGDTKSSDPYGEFKSVLPARYASPVTSPLRAEVVAGKGNTFRFDLEP